MRSADPVRVCRQIQRVGAADRDQARRASSLPFRERFLADRSKQPDCLGKCELLTAYATDKVSAANFTLSLHSPIDPKKFRTRTRQAIPFRSIAGKLLRIVEEARAHKSSSDSSRSGRYRILTKLPEHRPSSRKLDAGDRPMTPTPLRRLRKALAFRLAQAKRAIPRSCPR